MFDIYFFCLDHMNFKNVRLHLCVALLCLVEKGSFFVAQLYLELLILPSQLCESCENKYVSLCIAKTP